MEVLEVLKQAKVKDNFIFLPIEIRLHRNDYLAVAKVIYNMGGKWSKKYKGFFFKFDPTEHLNLYVSGENINLRKDFQFFETPDDIADHLVMLAGIKNYDVILEPSAGQGAIADAIMRKNNTVHLFCYEILSANAKVLKNKGYDVEQVDFLYTKVIPIYDRVIANPPFSKNQDIRHYERMFQFLKPGGRVTSIMSRHWLDITDSREEKDFKNLFLTKYRSKVVELDAGAFKSSGTNIETIILITDKK